MAHLRCSGLVWLCMAVTSSLLVSSPCFAQEPRPQDLRVRSGFTIQKYADVPYARQMVSVKQGEATITYVGSRKGWAQQFSDIWAVVDSNSDGTVDYVQKLVSDLITPSGVALRGNSLYVSGFNGTREDDTTYKGAIWRLDDVHNYALQKKEYAKPLTVVTLDLPGATWHGWRFMRFDENGELVIPIGIDCNVCEQNTTAQGFKFSTIWRINVDTGAKTLIADGVRNSVGFDWHPDTKQLYFTDNGRDDLGDNIPDDKLNRLTEEGQNFGYPYCSVIGPDNGNERPWFRKPGSGFPINDPDVNPNGTVKDCLAPNAFVLPVQIMGPHVAALGIRFYRWKKGGNFTKAFDRMAFIAQRGSWNRPSRPIGYRVMSIKIDPNTGKTSNYALFVSGWWDPKKGNGPDNPPWGRPNDVEFLPDGSLLISDDTAGMLFRVTKNA